MALRPSSQAGSALDGCLLLEALQEALSRLTAAAFVRKEVAQKIISVARQELIRVLVERGPSLPWLCVSSHLRLYRHSGAGSSAPCGTWLMILEDSHFAAFANASAAAEAAATGAFKPKSSAQLADALLVHLRKIKVANRAPPQQQQAATTTRGGADASFTPGEGQASEREEYETDVADFASVDEGALARSRFSAGGGLAGSGNFSSSLAGAAVASYSAAVPPPSHMALLANAALFSHAGFIRAFLHDRISGTESVLQGQTQRGGGDGRKRKANELSCRA